MTSFAEATAASRRLALLRLLVEGDGKANESVLKSALGALGFSGRMLGEGVRADLKYLAERDLVVTEIVLDRIMIGAITRRGVAYLAREVSPIEGVDYPSIGI